MTKEEIYAKIEEVYVSKNKEGKPTGRNFITHLIRSYFPVNKIDKIWDSKGVNMQCVFTKTKLVSANELFKVATSKEHMQKVTDHMLAALRGENHPHPLRESLNGRIMGYVGQGTDKAMCLEAAQAFIDWSTHKMLTDDYIGWLVGDIRKKETFKEIRKQLPDSEDQKKIDRIEKIALKPQRAVTSLGDMTALKELQEKLKAQGK